MKKTPPNSPPTLPRRSLLALAGLGLGAVALTPKSLAAGERSLAPEGRALATDDAAPTPDPDRGMPLTTATLIGKTLRVIRPGQAVTMDYSEDRVNVEVDDANRIVRVHIG